MAKSNDTREQINARVLKSIEAAAAAHPHVIQSMKAIMTKPWPKLAGAPISDAMLLAAAAFSKRTPQGEAGFIAGQLRDEGMSVLQLGQAFGVGPAHNHTRDHAGKVWHHFNRGKLGTGVYTLCFTPKGEKAVADFVAQLGAVAAEAKPAKATAKPAGKRKAKAKGKVAPSQMPISDQPTVTEGQPVTVSTDQNQQPAVIEPTVDVVTDDHTAVADALGVTADQLTTLAEHFNN